MKDVPILYGTIVLRTSEDEKALATAVKNYEMWPGGCVSTPESPKVRVTCTTCGFGFDAQFSHWSRSSTDPRSFHRPFWKTISSFPLPNKAELEDEVIYQQAVFQDQVMSESLRYSSRREREGTIQAINRWFQGLGQRPKYSEHESASDLTGTETIISKWGAGRIGVMLHYVKKERLSCVMMHVTRDDLDIRDAVSRQRSDSKPK